MAKTSIFQDPSTSLPKSDEQNVRVPFEEQQIGGRLSHIPKNIKSGVLNITHVPNAGSKH